MKRGFLNLIGVLLSLSLVWPCLSFARKSSEVGVCVVPPKQPLSQCLKKQAFLQLINFAAPPGGMAGIEKAVADYMAYLLLQGILSQPQQKFNIAEYDVKSALVDNLVYSFVSELEKKTAELQIYSVSEAEAEKLPSTIAPIIFLGIGATGLIFFPLNLKAMNIAGMSLLWSMRVGVRGGGQVISSHLKQWEGSHQNSSELSIDFALSGVLFAPYLVVVTAYPNYPVVLLVTRMVCAHGSSLLEEAQLADYQQQGLTEYEANQLCAQNNLGISMILLMIPASSTMKLINAILGTEFAKIGCDCALNAMKEDILPDHEWLKILPEFLLEGGVFLYCVLPVFNNKNPVDTVLRAKLRDGSVYYSGVRLTGYAISLISTILMAVYTATINYLP